MAGLDGTSVDQCLAHTQMNGHKPIAISGSCTLISTERSNMRLFARHKAWLVMLEVTPLYFPCSVTSPSSSEKSDKCCCHIYCGCCSSCCCICICCKSCCNCCSNCCYATIKKDRCILTFWGCNSWDLKKKTLSILAKDVDKSLMFCLSTQCVVICICHIYCCNNCCRSSFLNSCSNCFCNSCRNSRSSCCNCCCRCSYNIAVAIAATVAAFIT